MMAKKKLEFPTELFVYMDEDRGDVYFVASETERECASIYEDRIVGIYDLREVGKVSVNIVVTTE